MTSSKSLRQRLERLQPISYRTYCLTQENGESDLDVCRRAAALGYPVAILPPTCATAAEWTAKHAPQAVR
jgi:hypothetical protein